MIAKNPHATYNMSFTKPDNKGDGTEILLQIRPNFKRATAVIKPDIEFAKAVLKDKRELGLIEKTVEALRIWGIQTFQLDLNGKMGDKYLTQIAYPEDNPNVGKQQVFRRPGVQHVPRRRRQTGANTAMIFVPPRFAADSILEAEDAGIALVICITEGIPAHDELRVYNHLAAQSARRLIGPNCPGILSPGKANVGIIPASFFSEGNVGVVSRSGTLTYQIGNELAQRGFGNSSIVGIGGDPVPGSSFIDIIALFEADPETELIVMAGEIGGSAEEEAAEFIAENVSKPVVAYIAGFTAPPGKTMGHAGAIVSGTAGTAKAKAEALEAQGRARRPHPDRGGGDRRRDRGLAEDRVTPHRRTVIGLDARAGWSPPMTRTRPSCSSRPAGARRRPCPGRRPGPPLRHAGTQSLQAPRTPTRSAARCWPLRRPGAGRRRGRGPVRRARGCARSRGGSTTTSATHGQFVPDLPGRRGRRARLATFRDGRDRRRRHAEVVRRSDAFRGRPPAAHRRGRPELRRGPRLRPRRPGGRGLGAMAMDRAGNVILVGSRPGEVADRRSGCCPTGAGPDFAAGGTSTAPRSGLTGRSPACCADGRDDDLHCRRPAGGGAGDVHHDPRRSTGARIHVRRHGVVSIPLGPVRPPGMARLQSALGPSARRWSRAPTRPPPAPRGRSSACSGRQIDKGSAAPAWRASPAPGRDHPDHLRCRATRSGRILLGRHPAAAPRTRRAPAPQRPPRPDFGNGGVTYPVLGRLPGRRPVYTTFDARRRGGSHVPLDRRPRPLVPGRLPSGAPSATVLHWRVFGAHRAAASR